VLGWNPLLQCPNQSLGGEPWRVGVGRNSEFKLPRITRVWMPFRNCRGLQTEPMPSPEGGCLPVG
jgi:hypothetical protein